MCIYIYWSNLQDEYWNILDLVPVVGLARIQTEGAAEEDSLQSLHAKAGSNSTSSVEEK